MSTPVSAPRPYATANSAYPSTVRPSTVNGGTQYRSTVNGATVRSTPTTQYRSYNRPISRTPSWYTPNYRYRFSDSRYNSGYHYYPVYCDPFHGNLSSFVAGALVTNMILANGHRQPVYSNGNGGAYAVVDGGQVQMAQDENGNWVQLDPDQQAQVAQQQAQIAQTQQYPQQSAPIVVKSNGLGFWGWIGILGTIATIAILLIIFVL